MKHVLLIFDMHAHKTERKCFVVHQHSLNVVIMIFELERSNNVEKTISEFVLYEYSKKCVWKH